MILNKALPSSLFKIVVICAQFSSRWLPLKSFTTLGSYHHLITLRPRLNAYHNLRRKALTVLIFRLVKGCREPHLSFYATAICFAINTGRSISMLIVVVKRALQPLRRFISQLEPSSKSASIMSSLSSQRASVHLVCDFDGTITHQDTLSTLAGTRTNLSSHTNPPRPQETWSQIVQAYISDLPPTKTHIALKSQIERLSRKKQRGSKACARSKTGA